MNAWLGLEGPDIFAYMVSDVLGLLVFLWLKPTNITLAITASIFVSFHLFLAWLVVTADREKGFALPILSVIDPLLLSLRHEGDDNVCQPREG